jgi:predicted nucleic acid-binding protein
VFLLDTNVVPELRKVRVGRADRNVARWANSVDAAELFVSVITIHELELGVLLAERRDPPQGALFRAWLTGQVLPAFSGRIVPVDEAVALRSAKLHVPDPRPIRDSLIAATALVHGLTVVTRDVADFAPTGVALLNPWDAPRRGRR